MILNWLNARWLGLGLTTFLEIDFRDSSEFLKKVKKAGRKPEE